MNVKELFDRAENGTLNYEQFTTLTKEANAKFVDLSEGAYVSKSKYEDEIKAKDNAIETLNSTLSIRNGDLETVKKQLEDAGVDSQKLTELSANLSNLQAKYDADTTQYKEKLAKQAYEFAVKEFANTQKFTSNAAKRDFINSLTAKSLVMENDKILGADDFVKTYAESNSDAFVTETETKTQPTFVQPTNSPTSSVNDSPFHFNFTGVREKK
jgi:hypothetical protein